MLGSNDFKDFEKNEILFAESNGTNYIFQLNSKKGYQCFLFNQSFRKNKDINYTWNDYVIRKSTPLEKAWLKECIKQGKFVSLDEIKVNNNYRLWKLKINC